MIGDQEKIICELICDIFQSCAMCMIICRLYQGCTHFTLLLIILKLFNLKAINK